MTTKMSDIQGTGYGDAHDWKRTDQIGRCTVYVCRDCAVVFYHNYPRWPQIHEAMFQAKVPESCTKPTPKDMPIPRPEE